MSIDEVITNLHRVVQTGMEIMADYVRDPDLCYRKLKEAGMSHDDGAKLVMFAKFPWKAETNSRSFQQTYAPMRSGATCLLKNALNRS